MAGTNSEEIPPTPKTETPPPSSQQFNMDDILKIDPRSTFRHGITTAVSTTNTLLAHLEQTNTTANTHIVSRIRPIGENLRVGLQRSFIAYEQRRNYGVPIVVGSAVVVGAVVGVRRGKIPAVVMSAATGLGSYVGVYGVPEL